MGKGKGSRIGRKRKDVSGPPLPARLKIKGGNGRVVEEGEGDIKASAPCACPSQQDLSLLFYYLLQFPPFFKFVKYDQHHFPCFLLFSLSPSLCFSLCLLSLSLSLSFVFVFFLFVFFLCLLSFSLSLPTTYAKVCLLWINGIFSLGRGLRQE